ncbi:hypothetical protein [Bacillus cereus]|uniref:hypothetical protein n=1 Tax=Bacillus cereus TaxID=1396 RepID=UPI0018F71023|nr:hypothetical protein [Bacillus cereus]MBJ8025085.1 hypothetical protein [Bacillus cereus]MBJ8037561.1 hypothetical protein [Bacillus cereus]
MSVTEEHMKSRRHYIFERLKQPGYVNKSIQTIEQAKQEIQEHIEEMVDLLFLDAEDPCLPLLCASKVKGFEQHPTYRKVHSMTRPQLWDMEKEERDQILDDTLALVNEVFHLQRTIFIMLHQQKTELLTKFYEQRPQKKSKLHYDVNDGNGFNKKEYINRIRSLRHDIRVVAFRKFNRQDEIHGDMDTIKKHYETEIEPKIKEIVSIIDPSLIELDFFFKPIIEYGMNQISLEEMIRKLEGAFIQIHNISKVEYCPTLEMTVQQCKMLLLFKEADTKLNNKKHNLKVLQ